ncbi:MAG: helix-turn-helix transcriptional regulator [Rhizobiales bacterium]|nr:helix-turn-helix transcriptional regulator [Hyphomicrobiales bacterium]
MELNERLKVARKAAGLTQQAVAEHFDIARVSVTQWELGQTRPDQDKFTPLATLYGVSLDWLMDERGDGPNEQTKPTVRSGAASSKFIKSKAFKFYVQEWREFMGVKTDTAAKVTGMPVNEYSAFETYPINFGLVHIAALADEFGIRGDQFWFPPPKGKPAPLTPAARKKASRK